MRRKRECDPVPDEIRIPEPVIPSAVLVIKVGGEIFYAHICGNQTAREFAGKISSGGITLEMRDAAGHEKLGSLPFGLTRSEEEGRIRFGDIILTSDNGLAVYCGEDTEGPRCVIASVGDYRRDRFIAALGNDSVTVNISLEWGE